MAQIDLHTLLAPQQSIAPQNVTSDTTIHGVINDTNGFEGLEYVIHADTLSAGTFTPMLQHGDDALLADAEAVPTDFILGSIADAILVAPQNGVFKKIGYNGKKRYVKLSIVTTGGATGELYAAAILGRPVSVGVDSLT